MRRRRFGVILVAMMVALSTTRPVSIAQDQNSSEVLRKELADAMAQLKAAQDRKNELANEYEKLKAQLAAMQVQLDAANRSVAENADRNYAMRAQLAAWRAFVDRDPRLRARWELFLETAIVDLNGASAGDWFLESPKSPSLFDMTTMHSATQPTTASTTQPTTAPTMPPATQPAATTTTAPIDAATTSTSAPVSSK